MVDHVRQTIRENAVALAAPFVTTASAKRAAPIDLAELPFCAVLLADESVEQVHMGRPRIYDRTVALAFRVIVKGEDGFEDELDRVFAEIEAAFHADLTLSGVFRFATLRAISLASENEEGEDETVSRDLVFTGVYRTAENDPATPIIG